jgi:mannitol 2-dehydrogenase
MASSDRPPALALNRASVAVLPPAVRPIGYDPGSVSAAIVHLGLGGFHRAHMARYTHELMQRDPASRGWGILGAGLMRADADLLGRLAAQDGLYTLVERDGEAEVAAVIGSIAGILPAQDTAAILAAIDEPDIRIVSLTVTENGYCLDAATKRLDARHPLVQADIDTPARPASAPGVLVEALRRRRDAGGAPFTPLTCDNIQGNGHVLRQALIDHAALRDDTLAEWISAEVPFPSTMVDRITPRTTQADIEAVRARFGLRDDAPVVCERFTQWVIEDVFPRGRPRWEEVGAQMVADVVPYEMMKLRLLNASHLAVAGLGRLAGYVTIDEAMRDRRIAAVMRALMDRETGPTLPEIAGVDLPEYKQTLLHRFANRAIRDTVDRVNTDAPVNVLLDPIRDRLRDGQPLPLLALALAAWLYRVRGTDERGQAIELRHPLADELRMRAADGGPDARPLLSIRSLFGELGDDPRLVAAVNVWLSALYSRGIGPVLDDAKRLADTG